MKAELAYKRRTILEKELEDKYQERLVCLPNGHIARIQTIGVEWQGLAVFEVIVHVGNKRVLFDLTDFKTNTKILR